ncbi:methionine gamma-lyase [Natranaerobius thermophilus]|uniref:L-methionine gamma-lyase n=1 Tax=Natranaerobius thermophilus (strain ATCC BAA-1301 / DSM 18059 / JW/NM-WN-LF) TaxID=457570 RepID=B2A2C6_NATTJ|nr:methionine gamma-lyase [Natranaerobius thermophilus]ACB86232.1 cystathionine gamma-synthase [Natranaerobius thermophilus JW/NM-WN-LF]
MAREYKHKFETRAVHADEGHKNEVGALRTPIYQSSTFVFDNVEQGANRFCGEEAGYIYTRLGNPTQRDLEKQMANLEGAEDAIAVGSGMAAVSAVVMNLLNSGDHMVASDTLYGCTHSLFDELLPNWNVDVTFVDMTDPDNVRNAIRNSTKVIYTETPANPTLSIIDLNEIVNIAKDKNITTITDNTFMTPYLQRPIEMGIDVVIHSATKYLGGHGDTIGGVIVGSQELMNELRMTTVKDFGGIIGPFDAFLLLRGIKTLTVRMDKICENAKKIAKFLEEHSEVERVYYPGLESHPQHSLAKKQMGDFGGMITFELKGGYEAGKKLMNSVELCVLAVSLGDVDTLIQHPASMTHYVVPPEEREKAGITDGLVRLSVGIEDPEDVMNDLKQGMES